MKLKEFEKELEGRHLRLYKITYENMAGHDKTYEMISRNRLGGPEELGQKIDGMSICAFKDGKMLLLREFRMAVNRYVYNLCAGLHEVGESLEECVKRELYEETGLSVKRVIGQLPPCFAAVAISDIKTGIVFVEVEGEISDHSSENEEITPVFFSKGEIGKAIENEEFASRAQLIAYFFSIGALDDFLQK